MPTCVSASIDVDAVARNMDFVTLQDNVMNITFCNIESELVRISLLNFLYPSLQLYIRAAH